MNGIRKTNGITLISLIITIIIIIILVGISVYVVINGDLIGTAEKAGDKTKTAYENEGNMSIHDYVDNLPKLTVDVSEITATSVKIMAKGEVDDGDQLKYIFKLNGTRIDNLTDTNIWNISGLSTNKTYSYTIEVTDGVITRTVAGKFTTVNTPPELSVEISGLTATSVILTATGKDKDEQNLKYTLLINGTIIDGPTTTNIWNISGLSKQKTYSYAVKVTDGYDTVTQSGNFTTLQ